MRPIPCMHSWWNTFANKPKSDILELIGILLYWPLLYWQRIMYRECWYGGNLAFMLLTLTEFIPVSPVLGFHQSGPIIHQLTAFSGSYTGTLCCACHHGPCHRWGGHIQQRPVHFIRGVNTGSAKLLLNFSDGKAILKPKFTTQG